MLTIFGGNAHLILLLCLHYMLVRAWEGLIDDDSGGQ